MTIKELEIKLKRLRNLMQDKKLSAVYIKRQDNFAWLSCGGKNYVGIGDMGNCGLLVTADSCYAITNNIEAPRMADEERLGELGFAIHAGTWHEGNFEAETIRKLTGANATVGLDFASPLGVSAAEEIKQLRFSLTESELERYRETGYLVSLSLEETVASIRPGESEFEILGRLSVPWKTAASKALPNGFPEEDAVAKQRLQAAYDALPSLAVEGHPAQIGNFLAAIRGGEKLAIGGLEGRGAIELIMAIYKSSVLRAPVTLPITPEDPFYKRDSMSAAMPHFFEKKRTVENFATSQITLGRDVGK